MNVTPIAVGKGVGVEVGRGVEVGEGVKVGVAVGVSVGVKVGVGVGLEKSAPGAHAVMLKSKTIIPVFISPNQ